MAKKDEGKTKKERGAGFSHVFVDSSGRKTELEPDAANDPEYSITHSTVRMTTDGAYEFKHYLAR